MANNFLSSSSIIQIHRHPCLRFNVFTSQIIFPHTVVRSNSVTDRETGISFSGKRTIVCASTDNTNASGSVSLGVGVGEISNLWNYAQAATR